MKVAQLQLTKKQRTKILTTKTKDVELEFDGDWLIITDRRGAKPIYHHKYSCVFHHIRNGQVDIQAWIDVYGEFKARFGVL